MRKSPLTISHFRYFVVAMQIRKQEGIGVVVLGWRKVLESWRDYCGRAKATSPRGLERHFARSAHRNRMDAKQ